MEPNNNSKHDTNSGSGSDNSGYVNHDNEPSPNEPDVTVSTQDIQQQQQRHISCLHDNTQGEHIDSGLNQVKEHILTIGDTAAVAVGRRGASQCSSSSSCTPQHPHPVSLNVNQGGVFPVCCTHSASYERNSSKSSNTIPVNIKPASANYTSGDSQQTTAALVTNTIEPRIPHCDITIIQTTIANDLQSGNSGIVGDSTKDRTTLDSSSKPGMFINKLSIRLNENGAVNCDLSAFKESPKSLRRTTTPIPLILEPTSTSHVQCQSARTASARAEVNSACAGVNSTHSGVNRTAHASSTMGASLCNSSGANPTHIMNKTYLTATYPNKDVADVTTSRPTSPLLDVTCTPPRSVSPTSFDQARVTKLPGSLGKKLMKTKQSADGKPNIFVSKKTKNLVVQMPNGDVYEVANPPEGHAKDESTAAASKNGKLSRTGSLTVLKRAGSAQSRTSRSPSQCSVDAESSVTSLDLAATDNLPPVDTAEATHVCAIRLRHILGKLASDEINKEHLLKNLEYAASVLETVYIDETKDGRGSPTDSAYTDGENESFSNTVHPRTKKKVVRRRRLCDEDDELSEVEPDAVPSEVRDWLALTFTRSMSKIKQSGGEKPRFRSVANAIRAGIMVDKALKNLLQES